MKNYSNDACVFKLILFYILSFSTLGNIITELIFFNHDTDIFFLSISIFFLIILVCVIYNTATSFKITDDKLQIKSGLIITFNKEIDINNIDSCSVKRDSQYYSYVKIRVSHKNSKIPILLYIDENDINNVLEHYLRIKIRK